MRNDVQMLELLLKKNRGTSFQPIDLRSADFAEGTLSLTLALHPKPNPSPKPEPSPKPKPSP